MELIISLQDPATLAVALDQDVAGVAAPLPRNPGAGDWERLAAWHNTARDRGVKFFLIYDGLLREKDLAGAGDLLAAAARLAPAGLQLRDPGLIREARRQYPDLKLTAAANWGACNSPGLQLAAGLGLSRAVLAGPLSLTDLALIRRRTDMSLTIALGRGCRVYAGLCLMEEYLGMSCADCCLAGPTAAASLAADLETFSGLCQLGIEAVQLPGERLAPDSLAQVIKLYRSVARASPMERPRVLAAALEVVRAFGDSLQPSAAPPGGGFGPPAYPWPPAQRSGATAALPPLSGRGRVWLEARDYAEAAALSRQWREPLVLALTSAHYAAFLPEHRHWGPRRLIWRLPPAIPEAALAFYQKALETLVQGGHTRFVAGDWGGVGLVKAAGGQVYGDQTLGVRNSWSVKAAGEVNVQRVCLPPGHGVEHWQDLIDAAPDGRFWSYLYHCPVLAVGPEEAGGATPPETLRRSVAAGRAHLCLKASQNLLTLDSWFRQRGIQPLMAALPHSPRPRGEVPPWLRPRAGRPAGDRPRGKAPTRR